MSDELLPYLPGLAYGTVRKPMWSTDVRSAKSGRELRESYFDTPKVWYTIPFEYLRSRVLQPEVQTLAGFVNKRRGMFDSWLYRDPHDFRAALEPIGTGDGVTKSFRLFRTYGGFREAVYWPDLATLDFSCPMWQPDGGGVMWSQDGTTPMWCPDLGPYQVLAGGVIVFNTAPPQGRQIVWSGRFFYRCRFGSDGYDFKQDYSCFWSLSKLDFVGHLGGNIG